MNIAAVFQPDYVAGIGDLELLRQDPILRSFLYISPPFPSDNITAKHGDVKLRRVGPILRSLL